MLVLDGIPADRLDAEWPKIAGQMDELAALTRGRMTAPDYARAIRAQELQLWCARDGEQFSLMTTHVVNHPQLRECRVVGAYGHDADRWLALWPRFEAWARAQGCAVIVGECRPGWRKVLAPLGFDESSIVLEKRL